MSGKAKQYVLTKSEEGDLDILAGASAFWLRIRAAYTEWGTLTERQHQTFVEQRARDAWKFTAPKLGGRPIRNRFETKDGHPRCAQREQPWCPERATTVVGTYGYCHDHAAGAQESLDSWLAARKAERAQDMAASPVSTGNAPTDAAALTSRASSRVARMMDAMLDDSHEMPFSSG